VKVKLARLLSFSRHLDGPTPVRAGRLSQTGRSRPLDQLGLDALVPLRGMSRLHVAGGDGAPDGGVADPADRNRPRRAKGCRVPTCIGLSGLDLVALMTDGVHFADHLCRRAGYRHRRDQAAAVGPARPKTPP
jgi:hypothetical protein